MQKSLLEISDPPIFKHIMKFNVVAGLFLLSLIAIGLGTMMKEKSFETQREVIQRQKAREYNKTQIALNSKM